MATATITPMAPGPSATITPVSSEGDGALYSRIGGSYCLLSLKPQKGDSEHTERDLRQLAQDLPALWAKVLQQAVPVGATQVRVNLTHFYIAYVLKGASGVEQVTRIDATHQTTPEIQELMRRVCKTSTCLQRALYSSACNPKTKEGFDIVSKEWQKLHPRTLEPFMKRDFGAVSRAVNGDAGAAKRIVAVEAFINTLLSEVTQLKSAKQTEIDAQGFLTKPNAERQRSKEALQHLAELEALLQAIDRYPIYWAVGVCNHPTPSEQERLKMAEEISTAVNAALTLKIQPGNVEKPFVANYALETGELVLTPWQRIGRLDETDRNMKGVSAEAFVVETIITPNVEAPFGIPFDPETIRALRRAVTAARQAYTSALNTS